MERFNQMRGPEYFMEFLPNRGVSNISPVALIFEHLDFLRKT